MPKSKNTRKKPKIVIRKPRLINNSLATPIIHGMWFDPFVSFWEELYKFGTCTYDENNEPVVYQIVEGKWVTVYSLVTAFTNFFRILHLDRNIKVDLSCYMRVAEKLYKGTVMRSIKDIKQGWELLPILRKELNTVSAKEALSIIDILRIKRAFDTVYPTKEVLKFYPNLSTSASAVSL